MRLTQIKFQIGIERRVTGVLVLLIFLTVISVFGGQQVSSDSEPELPPIREVDLIAFRDSSARIQLISPDGTNPRLLNLVSEFTNHEFAWPTWSPNAKNLVFTKLEESPGGISMSLEKLDLKTGLTTLIHSGPASQIASGVFYYSIWSPDDKRLAFIVTENGSLKLYFDSKAEDVSSNTPAIENGPIWMDWSFDSKYLLAHRRDGHFLLDISGGVVKVKSLGLFSPSYRVPSWQPGTTKATMLRVNDAGAASLLTADLIGDELIYKEFLMDIQADATFSWSPDGRYMSIGGPKASYMYLGLLIGVHSGIKIYNNNYSLVDSLQISEPVISFFWSPDSSKLAYVSIADNPGVLRWMVLDVTSGRRWPLVDFVPSLDQLTLFQFFDQYTKSHSIWSPNSREIVFAGTEAGLAVSASFPPPADGDNPLIYVVDVEQNPVVSAIADGFLGVWSPR